MEELLTILGLPVMPYAVCVFGAAAIGILVLFINAKQLGVSQKDSEWFAVLCLAHGIFYGHLLYGLTQIFDVLDQYGMGFLLNPAAGGSLYFGVFIGIVLAALIEKRFGKTKASVLLDAAAPALLLVIALCRFAEPLDGQGWGMLIEEGESFFPLAFKPYAEYDEWYYAIFFYEGLYTLTAFLYLQFGKKKRADGQKALLALVLYCTAQVLFETLRRDIVVKWLFVRVSQLFCVIALAALLTAASIKRRRKGRHLVRKWILFVLLTGLCVAIEFTVDKPLSVSSGLLNESIESFLTKFGLTVQEGEEDGRTLIYLPYAMTYAVIGISAFFMGRMTWNAIKE